MAFGTYDQGSSDRGLSTKLWLGCNPDVIRNDPRHGMFFLDDFTDLTDLPSGVGSHLTDGKRQLVKATSGSLAPTDDESYGVGALAAGAATANQGATLFYPGVTIAPTAGTTVVMECRVKAETITTGLQFYAGLVLATLDTTPITGGAIASDAEDHVGFYTENNLVAKIAAEDGGSASVSSTNAHTFASGTYVKLGFRINGVDDIEVFVDGTKIANSISADSIPEDTTLRLALACLAEGNDSSVASFDWVAVGAF